jgi:hypothetical protein
MQIITAPTPDLLINAATSNRKNVVFDKILNLLNDQKVGKAFNRDCDFGQALHCNNLRFFTVNALIQ